MLWIIWFSSYNPVVQIQCHGVTMVLPWYYSGFTVVLPWYYRGVTEVLPWCYFGATAVLPWYHMVTYLYGQK